MSNEDFDPVDPPPTLEGHPLHDYLKPPLGLSKLTAAQVILAIVFIILGIAKLRGGELISLSSRLSIILPAGLLAISGLGLRERRGWGWWLTATLFYCIFFNLPVDLILWTVRGVPFHLATHLIVFGVAVFVLAYITRPEILRFIRFSTPDGRPTRPMLLSPVLVGLAWSIVLLVRSLMHARV